MFLSVALCTHNGEKYIKEQLTSILNQELPVNEIIVCDDDSSDNTINLVNHIMLENPSYKWNIQINKPKLGILKNFEKAINLCTGQIVFLSDQDDIWESSKTRIVVERFNSEPFTECIYSNAILIGSSGTIISRYTLFDAVGLSRRVLHLCNNQLTYLVLCAWGNRMTGATMAFRSSLKEFFLPFSSEIPDIHDGQIALSAVRRNSISFISDPLIYYRVHESNSLGLRNSWIFRQDTSPFRFSQLYKLHEIPSYYLNSSSQEFNALVSFHNKRLMLIQSLKGRIILLLSLFEYLKHYKEYGIRFLLSDLATGIFNVKVCS